MENIHTNKKNINQIRILQIIPSIINIVIVGLIAFVLIDNNDYAELINLEIQQITNLQLNFYSIIISICLVFGIYTIILLLITIKNIKISNIPILSYISFPFMIFIEIFLIIMIIQYEWLSIYEIYNVLGIILGKISYLIIISSILIFTVVIFRNIPKKLSYYSSYNFSSSSSEQSNKSNSRKKAIFKKGFRPRMILIFTIVWYVIYIPFFCILAFQQPRLIFWEYNTKNFNWSDILVIIHIISFIISLIVGILIYQLRGNKENRAKSKLIVSLCFFAITFSIQYLSLILLAIKYDFGIMAYNPLSFLTVAYSIFIIANIAIKKYTIKAKNKKTATKVINLIIQRRIDPRKTSAFILIIVSLTPIVWIAFYQPMFTLMPRSISDSSNLSTVKNTYDNLTYCQKTLFDEYLDHEFPTGTNATDYLSNYTSTRSAARIASGLLFRNHTWDIQNASIILEWLIPLQNTNESDRRYGTYKTRIENDSKDENWREFIGCELILIIDRHESKLSSDLSIKIRESLLMAAEGAKGRNIAPTYTNIAIMSSFLMAYVGVEMNRPDIEEIGLLKAWQCYILFNRDEAFSEFNSPTYDGVTMMGLAFWRDIGPHEEIKKMGANLEALFWKNIALLYHPGFKNMVGPFFRSYAMDMRVHNAILGIWISLAINDPDNGPLPRKTGSGYFELSNICPAVQLGHSVNDEIKNRLRTPPSPHFIEKGIPTAVDFFSKKHKVTIMINEDWMMGGVVGRHKERDRSQQIKVGTIYWNSSVDQSLMWLMVPSDGTQDVEVDELKMRISRNEKNSSLLFFIQGNNLTNSIFDSAHWSLPGLNLTSSLDPSSYSLELADTNQFKSDFSVSGNMNDVYEIRCNSSEIILELNS